MTGILSKEGGRATGGEGRLGSDHGSFGGVDRSLEAVCVIDGMERHVTHVTRGRAPTKRSHKMRNYVCMSGVVLNETFECFFRPILTKREAISELEQYIFCLGRTIQNEEICNAQPSDALVADNRSSTVSSKSSDLDRLADNLSMMLESRDGDSRSAAGNPSDGHVVEQGAVSQNL